MPGGGGVTSGMGFARVISAKTGIQPACGAVLTRTKPVSRGSIAGVASRYSPPVEWPTATGFGTAPTASTRTWGHRSYGSAGAPGAAVLEPSPGRSTSQLVPGGLVHATRSIRLSAPIPGPPGRNNQFSEPGVVPCRRSRTPPGVNRTSLIPS